MKKIINKNILCIILARGGSKGIPLKNIYKINDHPLVSYTIAAAKKSKYIDDVYISTDNEKIAKECVNYGAIVPYLRSKKYAKDRTTSVDALKYSVKKLEKIKKKKYEYIIELPCVSPFRDEKDINKALEILTSSNYDSVISYVNTGEKHPIRLKRINKNKVSDFCKEYPEPFKGSRRQDFEPCYIRNGAIYAMKRECLFKQNSRQGKKSFPLIMSENKSINIDEKFDLLIAQQLIENGYCSNVPKKIENYIEYSDKKNKKYDVLITTKISFNKDDIVKKFKQYFNFVIVNSSNQDVIKKFLKNAKVWLCSPSPDYKIDSKLLQKANCLKLIITPSTGTTHIDTNYCQKKNIEVKNLLRTKLIKKIYASSEYTFSLSLSLIKKIPKAIKLVKSGFWRDSEDLLRSNELKGKKVGIIGYGRIGKNLAKYCKTFGMKISAYDPFINIKSFKGVKYNNNFKKLLSVSDIVFICVNYSSKNYKLVNSSWFKSMKKGSVFINTSRGEVVCEKSLIGAIKSKKISRAAVDVVNNEQGDLKKNPLINFSKKDERLIITPHIAGLTYESETKAAIQSLLTLKKYKGVIF